MFLERGVASCSFGSVPLAVHYSTLGTLSASYLPDNELEGKGAWWEPAHDITKRDQVNIVNIEMFQFEKERCY
jgi:hypothetical protein